jgi:dTDP-4-amino-4,6-dideoxygalactose transaminase
MNGEELKYINKAFEENWISPYGSNIEGFENELKQYFGDESVNVTLLNSGTAAIHLGLILLGVGKGDEILVQSHTHIASVNPIIYLGGTPVFIDSEPDTWNICPGILEEAIKDRINKGRKPKAIIAAHLYGMPYKAKELHEVAQRYGIPVLEDSAEALGSSYDDKKCGTLADIGILSFNGNKIITTSGGGAIITKRADWKEKIVYLASQAKDNTPYYQHREIGYNYRMSNICAGIGRGQMKTLEQYVGLRRGMHDFYIDLFSTVEGVSVLNETDSTFHSNHWLSVILMSPTVKTGLSPEGVRAVLEQHNIESRHLWKPMHLQPVFKDCEYYGGTVCENLFNNGLCLPSGSNLTIGDKERISEVLTMLF